MLGVAPYQISGCWVGRGCKAFASVRWIALEAVDGVANHAACHCMES